jgi:dihydrofolate reductase
MTTIEPPFADPLTMRKTILFMGMSLDGYIAGPDDNLEFLSMVERPGEDYGYTDFIQGIDTVVMARRTYEIVLGFGGPWPHAGKRCYVVSRTRTGADENVTFFNGPLSELIATLKSQPGKDIYVDGGPEFTRSMLQGGLIDRFGLSVLPILLGGGVRLFDGGFGSVPLRLESSKSYESGMVQSWYVKA